MSITQASDFTFVPKVWADEVSAYFRKKLVMGALALHDDTLATQPGLTVNFPYFKAISAAEEPGETVALSVDKLTDDSFSATVKEVGKAMAFTDKSLKVSVSARERIFSEAQAQIGRILAEKVDADLITEVNTSGNFDLGFSAAAAADKCTIANILQGKVNSFGDKHDEAVAIIMHSQSFLTMMKDSSTGFLQGNSLDPFWGMSGFQGRLLGMALITADTMPQEADVAGKKAYASFVLKPNPYGILMKQDVIMEQDRDILARETVVTATTWYAVKAFHSKINALDKKICKMIFATELSA